MQLHSVILGDPTEQHDLLILHGLYGSSSNWRSLGLKYAQVRRVHLLDLRNHGRSPWHEQHDYIQLADDISRYVRSHGIEKYDLLGHSMGGKTAMAQALAQPSQLNKLIVADISPIRYFDNEHDAYIAAMNKTLEAAPSNRNEAEDELARYIQNSAIRQFFLQNFTLEENENGIIVAKWRINLQAIETNLSHILDFPLEQLAQNQFHGPTLFVYGERSDYVQDAHHEQIVRLFPDAIIEPIADASHWLHAEKPNEFYQATEQFLQSS